MDLALFADCGRFRHTCSYIYLRPIVEVTATSLMDVPSALEQLINYHLAGRFLVGYLKEELIQAITDEIILARLAKVTPPLLHYIIYEECLQLPTLQLYDRLSELGVKVGPPTPQAKPFNFIHWHEHGEINYFDLEFSNTTIWQIFLQILQNQTSGYIALVSSHQQTSIIVGPKLLLEPQTSHTELHNIQDLIHLMHIFANQRVKFPQQVQTPGNKVQQDSSDCLSFDYFGFIHPSHQLQFRPKMWIFNSKQCSYPQLFTLILNWHLNSLQPKINKLQHLQVHLAPLLNHYQPKFSLREVLLVYRQLPLNLAAHLQRIENSAQKLWFKFCKEIVRQQILNFCSDLSYDNEYMLTLSLDYLGEVAISAEILPPPRWPLKIMLLNKQLDLSHPLFEHKTNASLSSELFRYLDARYRPGGVDKLIFINQDGLMIGSNNANLILGIKHKWYTPAVSAGVLRGSYRESLLAFGEIAEANLTPSDLKTAHKIMLINDLYGLTVCQFMGIVE